MTLIDYKCKGISFETEENIMSMSKKNGDGWFIKESQKEVSLKLHFPGQYKVRSVEVMVLCAREIIL